MASRIMTPAMRWAVAPRQPLTATTASRLCSTIWRSPASRPTLSRTISRPFSTTTPLPRLHRTLRTIRAISVYLVKLFALVHLIHALVFEVRDCAGASMLPTLSLEGDVLLQMRLPLLRSWDRLKAGLASSPASGPRKKQHSAAPGDLLSILRPGDLVVALSPFDPTRVVCKRLIGLPGDTILVEPRLGLRPAGGGGRKKRWRPSADLEEDDLERIREAWREPSLESDILREFEDVGPQQQQEREARSKRRTDADEGAPLLLHRPSYVTVPPGHVWLCGDNMGNSSDSRDYGPVPMGLLRGKVVARLFPSPRWFRDAVTEA